MSSSSYHAIIIGSGQAGTPLALAFAKAGHKTALIESKHIGGTCINEGCTPTKTMVASARVKYLCDRGGDYGVETENRKMVMETVRKRKRDIVNSFRGGSEARIKAAENLTLLMGKAKFVGSKTLDIVMNKDEKVTRIEGENIFINAGCEPAKLAIPGVESIEVLDSTTVMELNVVPDHLIVVGGGYVGVEFAQMFRRFGAKVTIVQRAGQILGREDEDVAEAVRKILVEDGVEILLDSTPKSVSKTSGGGMELRIESTKDGNKQELGIQGSHLLAAAGRTPSTKFLDPSSQGIELDRHGFVKVNDQLITNVPGVYALGDVKGGPQFTHVSYDDFRVIRHNLIEHPNATALSIKDRLVPYTVFMDPQLGRIGLSETEARKMYPKDSIKVAKMPMAYVARALEMDETRGLMKAVIQVETKKILGAAILGIEGGEIVTMLQIAMMGGVSYDQLQNAVFAHPGLGESLNNLWGFLE